MIDLMIDLLAILGRAYYWEMPPPLYGVVTVHISHLHHYPPHLKGDEGAPGVGRQYVAV